ncbi:ATP-binding protein [Cryptosporangium sp. NPDC051539]|uniref:ATP-binding protein n=1 Tax=Cryptosporangium sp. NPDC051539 TaxID=3363962 RepID=UPI0037A9BE20
MRTVRLAFSPTPAHVRTARLVAVATARNAGVAESLLDEIRLAVGEACSRAVSLHVQHKRSELVEVEFTDGPRFEVVVRDSAPADQALHADLAVSSPFVAGPAFAETESEEEVAAGVGLALLTGLVDDVTVTAAEDRDGTIVHMTWVSAAR